MTFVERIVLLFVATLFVANSAYAATQHLVGGSEGWDESTDFDSWASKQTFKVGDQLVFKYTPGLHSVTELDSERAYKNCDITKSANSLTAGNDAIKLNKVGTRYFVCGTTGHCAQGMKLKVIVDAATVSSFSSSPHPDSASMAFLASHSPVNIFILIMTAGALLVPAFPLSMF